MPDPLTDLIALRELDVRRIVGLMSGTSADGIDVAIVEVRGSGQQAQLTLLGFTTCALDQRLKYQIWSLPDGRAANLCELNFMIGEAFAAAVDAACQDAGLSLDHLHLIGSHGQTARHQPPTSGGETASTLQIGEGAVIAEHTGLPVICDFRVADVAAGGQGAPLIPLLDSMIARRLGEPTLMLNLGGIANITLIDPANPAQLVAFDTGPSNIAIDAVSRAATGQPYDRDGELASTGHVDRGLLRELLEHPFFERPPPKSTGREMFGRDFVYPLIDRFAHRLEVLIATLGELTVESIARAIERFVSPEPPRRVLTSGGGIHNGWLMSRLRSRLAPLEVETTAAVGIDPDAKEAIGFALLANETLFGNPSNVVAATGARGPRVLGKIVLPPPRPAS